MDEVNSPTRRYRIELDNSLCCHKEHRSIYEARKCGGIRGSLRAVDWAFGLRAFVPTFGSEWSEDARISKTLRETSDTYDSI